MNTADADQLTHQLDAICSIDIQFDGFDDCTSGSDLETVIASGAWGRYFDSVRVLPSHIVQTLTSDDALDASWPSEPVAAYGTSIIPAPRANSYPFRVRGRTPRKPPPYDRGREMADPELTRIKMQRRNLAHKELVDKMDELLRGLGAEPKENEHIDLFSQIPGDGFFIFEMKSGGEGILDQIRKGLSQLYEYRYRYRPTSARRISFFAWYSQRIRRLFLGSVTTYVRTGRSTSGGLTVSVRSNGRPPAAIKWKPWAAMPPSRRPTKLWTEAR